MVTEVRDRSCTYQVDAEDRIRSVGGQWASFAAANGAPELTPEAVIGRSLWDFVAGREVEHVSRLLLQRVRRLRKPITLPFRCDSPSLRRFMELSIAPEAHGGIGFEARLIREEPRAHTRLLDASAPRSEELIGICSWCKRVLLPDYQYVEIEVALKRLALLLREEMPSITHILCPDCEQLFEKGRAAMRRGAS